jgi:hypothetical protein
LNRALRFGPRPLPPCIRCVFNLSMWNPHQYIIFSPSRFFSFPSLLTGLPHPPVPPCWCVPVLLHLLSPAPSPAASFFLLHRSCARSTVALSSYNSFSVFRSLILLPVPPSLPTLVFFSVADGFFFRQHRPCAGRTVALSSSNSLSGFPSPPISPLPISLSLLRCCCLPASQWPAACFPTAEDLRNMDIHFPDDLLFQSPLICVPPSDSI